MSCPFLKEGRAQYCHAAPIRKMILEGPGVSRGRCASPEYFRCDLVAKDEARQQHCPHLEDVRVQYCGATSPTKLVPFSESQLSNCDTEGYRYCETYLSLARPHGAMAPAADLLYSVNHFWLAAENSGLCYIGIDGLLAQLVGSVQGMTFVTTHGTQRPVVSLTLHGIEWPMTFPNPLLIQKVNSHLRSDPRSLTADPYGKGWLFTGWEVPGRTRSGLITGAHAAAWQAEERVHFAQETHERLLLNCDGGYPLGGVGQLLSRQQLVCLLQHFFSERTWGPRDMS